MDSSTHDKAQGTAKEAVGKVKEETGKAIGNQDLEDRGTAEKVGGKDRAESRRREKGLWKISKRALLADCAPWYERRGARCAQPMRRFRTNISDASHARALEETNCYETPPIGE